MGILFKSRIIKYIRKKGRERGISSLKVSSRYLLELENLIKDFVKKYTLDDLKKLLKDEG